jgi:hypothetical protein
VLEARADFKSNFEPLLRGMRVATLLHSVGMCLPSSGPGEATTSPRQCRAFPSRTSQSPPLAGPISEFLLGGTLPGFRDPLGGVLDVAIAVCALFYWRDARLVAGIAQMHLLPKNRKIANHKKGTKNNTQVPRCLAI